LQAGLSESYSYDGLNQLETFNRAGTVAPSNQQWAFDALGNWTTLTTDGVPENRTANAQNQYTDVGGTALTYSANGNLTTDQEGRTLIYDAWNRLISVKNSGGTALALYGYDGLNRRITEQVATDAIPDAAAAAIRDLFYSADWQVLEERVRTGGVIPATAATRYVWSPVYVDAMVLRDRNADGNSATGPGGLEERVYVLQDGNWNTTALIAGSVSGKVAGDVMQRYVYTPYGEASLLTPGWAEQIPPPEVPWQHQFQGLKITEMTGLAYVRNRDFSASLGRFIELDPMGFNAGDNNFYRFVGNRPIDQLDPLGLDYLDCMAACLEDNDPIDMALEAALAGLIGMPIPKTWVLAWAEAVGDTQLARAIRASLANPNSSRLTTLPSALSAQLRAGGRSSLRLLGRTASRIAGPVLTAYGLALAFVETYCAGVCTACWWYDVQYDSSMNIKASLRSYFD
jgi:RHS repeat-associated protein